jgi:LuxR family maltose regulon positive regulatory protein
LFAELEAGIPGGVTLISAPAGSGKTMLLSSWLGSGRARDPVAWVGVERGETDPTRFFASVARALRESGAIGADHPLANLAAAPLGGHDEYVERMIDGLEQLDRPLVLVLDDLHELGSDEALRGLGRLLEAAPPALRVVIATRRDPKLGLHRLRLDGRLTEIRGDDLRFTTDETGVLLGDAGVELEDGDLEQLQGRTEGWAAGLRLASLSLARHDDPARFVSEFSGSERTIAEYLLAEVLAHQDRAARELLLSTCILERVTPELADVLTGTPGSGRLLLELEEANALVTAVDVSRSWYRYHHLLADLLRLELQREWPDRVPALHSTAATWLAEHGEMTAAIRHAVLAQDWPFAADLLARNWVDLVLNGEEQTLRALTGAIPTAALESDPELATAAAAALIADARWDDVDALLDKARALLPDVTPDRRRRAQVGLTTVDLLRGRRLGGVEDVDVDDLLASEGLDLDLQALATTNIGIAEVWSLRIPEARAHLERGLELGRRAKRPYIEVTCLSNLGFVANIQHDLARAEQLFREAVAATERYGWTTQEMVGIAYLGLGQILVDTGRMTEGGEWLARADPLMSEGSEAPALLALRHAQGMIAIASGRFGDALAAWREAERIGRTLRSEHFLTIAARQWQLRARIGLGELDVVATELLDRDEGAEWHNLEARLLLARGDAAGAVAALAPVLAGKAPFYHVNLEIEVWMLDGIARDALGDRSAAHASVERSLALAEPQHRVWMISTIPGAVDVLRGHALHDSAYAAFVTELIDDLSGHERRRDDELDEPLTDRELAVLRFLPTNMSAPEIGREMYLSVHTVKTYMRRLYAKLDAHSRNEAVGRARELGLLGMARR